MSGRSTVSVTKTARHGERGNATAKFLVVIVLLFLIGYGGYNYLITWYQCAEVQTAMKESIDRANMSSMATDRDPEKIKQYIQRKGASNNMPADAVIKIEKSENGVAARVQFTRDVAILPFNLYNYKYVFNQTAGPPGGFLTK
jgi:Flp pilus assembly protein TadG